MGNFPAALMPSLRQILLDCDEFSSQNRLYATFSDPRIKIYQRNLPEGNNVGERVDLTINFLLRQYKRTGENALVLFIDILGEKYEIEDERYERLQSLGKELSKHLLRQDVEKASSTEADPSHVNNLQVGNPGPSANNGKLTKA